MNEQVATYANNTRKSSDWLRKFSHGARFKVALEQYDVSTVDSVLDFGGGDGAFLRLIHEGRNGDVDCVLFEPFMDAPDAKNFTHYKTWDMVESHLKGAGSAGFDLVYCQEVLEHFSPQRQEEALSRIASVLKPRGTLVVSVPVEVGPVALV